MSTETTEATDWAIRDGRLILGTTACVECMRVPGKATHFRVIVCIACKGTGRRGRGRCGACADSYGYGHVRPGRVLDYSDAGIIVDGPCTGCNGSTRVPATMTSTVPAGLLDALPIEFVDTTSRGMTWAESYLGLGLFSIVDYGYGRDELKVTQYIREHRTQACKVARDDGTLCQAIVVLCRRDGYSVVPRFA